MAACVWNRSCSPGGSLHTHLPTVLAETREAPIPSATIGQLLISTSLLFLISGFLRLRAFFLPPLFPLLNLLIKVNDTSELMQQQQQQKK